VYCVRFFVDPGFTVTKPQWHQRRQKLLSVIGLTVETAGLIDKLRNDIDDVLVDPQTLKL
jgi:hypothetical protein